MLTAHSNYALFQRYAQHFVLKAKRVRRQQQDDGEKAGFSWTVAWDVFKQVRKMGKCAME